MLNTAERERLVQAPLQQATLSRCIFESEICKVEAVHTSLMKYRKTRSETVKPSCTQRAVQHKLNLR